MVKFITKHYRNNAEVSKAWCLNQLKSSKTSMVYWLNRCQLSQSEGLATRMSSWPTLDVLTNKRVVRLGWAIYLLIGLMLWNRVNADMKYGILANEWVVRLGWGIDQSEDSLANEKVQNVWIRILFSKWESSKTRMTDWPWTRFLVAHQHLPGRLPSEANERVLKLGWTLD